MCPGLSCYRTARLFLRRAPEERCDWGACMLPAIPAEGDGSCRPQSGSRKVQIANEPELAARAHGAAQHDERLAMVFDLGGGTLDVSLVDVGGRTAEVIATAGDLNLGGDDFTRRLLMWTLL